MRSTRVLIAAAATVLSVVAWSPASAKLGAVPTHWCAATGTIDVSVDASTGVATWRVGGVGDCTDLYNVDLLCTDRYGDPCTGPGPKPDFTLSGSGTSDGAGGLCGGVLVKNLRLVMTLEVPEFAADTWDGESWWGIYTVKQKWLSGDSTFPGVAQFRIAAGDSGQTMGAGSIVDTAVQKCPSQQGHSKARFVLLFG